MMLNVHDPDELVSSVTKGFLTILDSPTKRLRCSSKTASEAEIVGLESEAGSGILSRAMSNSYEPEVAIENGDYITIVYKRRVKDGRDSYGSSEEKSNFSDDGHKEDTGDKAEEDDLLSVSQVDSREVMPPPLPPKPTGRKRFNSSFCLPSPLRASTPIQTPAKKRKLSVVDVSRQSLKKSFAESNCTEFEDQTFSTSFTSSVYSSSSIASRRPGRNLPDDQENRVDLNLHNTSFSSSNKSDRAPRVVYSKREIEAIYHGVSVYGDKDWKSIYLAYLTTFHQSRTPVKLYDKWRQQLNAYPDAKTYFERKVKKDFMTSRHHHTYW